MHARKRLMFKNRDRARKAANHAAATPVTPVVEKTAPVTPVVEKAAPVVEKTAPVVEKAAPKAKPFKKTSTTKSSAITSKKK